MNKCAICGTEQKQVGSFRFLIGDEIISNNIPTYNIDLLTYIKGKHICNNCMDIYNKIYALYQDIDFSCGGIKYCADGSNLK